MYMHYSWTIRVCVWKSVHQNADSEFPIIQNDDSLRRPGQCWHIFKGFFPGLDTVTRTTAHRSVCCIHNVCSSLRGFFFFVFLFFFSAHFLEPVMSRVWNSLWLKNFGADILSLKKKNKKKTQVWTNEKVQKMQTSIPVVKRFKYKMWTQLKLSRLFHRAAGGKLRFSVNFCFIFLLQNARIWRGWFASTGICHFLAEQPRTTSSVHCA